MSPVFYLVLAIMGGDVGEAAFYIRRSDLERRDFSRVAFYWDCH